MYPKTIENRTWENKKNMKLFQYYQKTLVQDTTRNPLSVFPETLLFLLSKALLVKLWAAPGPPKEGATFSFRIHHVFLAAEASTKPTNPWGQVV